MNNTEIESLFGIVRKELDEKELLSQLAEEASELSQAALKLRRAMSGDNPTPRTVQECTELLKEEIADVSLAVDVLNTKISTNEITEIKDRKLKRLCRRLIEKKIERKAPKKPEDFKLCLVSFLVWEATKKTLPCSECPFRNNCDERKKTHENA